MRWLLLLFADGVGGSMREPVRPRPRPCAEDAVQYAAQFGVPPDEALRRLKAQQASVAATDAIAQRIRRLVSPGSAIEHAPSIRIVVLLTGNEPVADREANGVPIVFTNRRQGHARAEAVAAMRKHLIDLRDRPAECARRRLRPADRRGGAARHQRRRDSDSGIDAIRERAEQVERRAGAGGRQRAHRIQHERRRRRPGRRRSTCRPAGAISARRRSSSPTARRTRSPPPPIARTS